MWRAYEKTLALLQVNPHHPSLRLHELGGRLKGVHSVSINLSYRITLHLWVTEHQIVPLDVGEHDCGSKSARVRRQESAVTWGG